MKNRLIATSSLAMVTISREEVVPNSKKPTSWIRLARESMALMMENMASAPA